MEVSSFLASARPRQRVCRAPLVLALSSLLLMPPIGAATRSVDLGTEADVKVKGAGPVSAVGDVNGDGISDVAIGECFENNHQGRVYILFGPFGTERFDLSDPAQFEGRGFRIDGPPQQEGIDRGEGACKPAPAGDVNGDGLADILIGAHYAYHNERLAGAVYVVFGKSDSVNVDLADFYPGPSMEGFAIDGAFFRDKTGSSNTFGGLGDLNGDGLDDVLVAPRGGDAAYVVFGKTDTGRVDLLTFAFGPASVGGYRIDRPFIDPNNDFSAAAAGDVNGDGIGDILIGLAERNRVFVVFGKADSMSQDVTSLSEGGFVIKGRRQTRTGESVSGVGDMNGDGLADVAIGAVGWTDYSDKRSIESAGSVFVVWGKQDADRVRLRSLGDGGFRVKGGSVRNGVGYSVAPGGDVNGDGVPDLLIGAMGFRHHPHRRGYGSAYVIFGKSGRRALVVTDLGRRGYRIDGPRRVPQVGASVAGPGNVVGGPLDDIMIGTPGDRAFIISGRR